MRIKQAGYPDIRLKRARFYSEPLIMPVYWDWRFCKWIDRHSIEFEAIHHKLYLRDQHPDIQRFGISHGYNILTLNYGRRWHGFIFRNGIGSVLMHPESTIRGQVYPEGPGFDIKGYRLRGFAFNTALARKFMLLRERFYINTEIKITFAHGNAPIVNGTARVSNLAGHAIAGFGINFAKRH